MGVLTSVPVLQSQANLNDLHPQLVVKVSDSEHLRPESFPSCEERKGKVIGPEQLLVRSCEETLICQ